MQQLGIKEVVAGRPCAASWLLQGVSAALSAMLALPCLAGEAAPAYPAKPVSVIIPFTPGSSQETEGRVHMGRLSEQLKQPFVIDFKPGGSTTIGLAFLARSAPDGYTLLLASGSLSLVPLRQIALPFDPLTAFAPVSLLSKRWSSILMHPSVPGTVKELFAWARANPGKLNFATNGPGSQSHLTGAWMADAGNVDITFVHYKSSAQIFPDLLSGRVHLTTITLTTGLPFMKTGKAKLLGMANLSRNPAFPDMPTIAEQGIRDFEYSSWQGVIAPAKTPPAIVNLLSAELAKVVKAPEVVKRLEQETQLIGSTPGEFAKHIAGETARWSDLIKRGGIVLEE